MQSMPDRGPNLVTFTTPTALAEHMAAEVASLLAQAVQLRGAASLVVSGGSTPKLLFNKLSRQEIDWQRVIITLADERWVEPADPASNENLVRSLLLQNNASTARFVGLKNDAPTARAGEENCNRRVAAMPHPFDVVLLGMGSDGHTASLFPGAAHLNDALSLSSEKECLAIFPPNAQYERMTLTLPTLLDSRMIILHITGKEKKGVLDKALGGGPAEEMPIRSILRQKKTPLLIYWAP